MAVQGNFSLRDYNTFGLTVSCKEFLSYKEDEVLFDFLRNRKNLLSENFFVLGGGSNVVFTSDYEGLILHPVTHGRKVVYSTREHVFVEAQAGEVWDDFVAWTIAEQAYGLENLSYIPGTVGASAVQNIGAYGVEAADFIHRVKFLHLESGDIQYITNEACCFGYRDSIFKHLLKNKAIILSVVFKLNKNAQVNRSYSDVEMYLSARGIEQVSPSDIRSAIIDIRKQKLPEPTEIGSAGSFFKNPIVGKETFERLQMAFPDIKYFLSGVNYKLAAGWLIDKCGLKGFSHKGASVHKNQALILINNGKATGSDVVELSRIIQERVSEKFGVELQPEVIII